MAMEVFKNITLEPATVQVVPRPKPMKVLVLGLSRTGTMSMWTALHKLGLESYHFIEVARNMSNNHVSLWTKAIMAKYHGQGKAFEGSDFDQMLWNYDAVTDVPCCLFVDELLSAYPDAKVVLTVRAKESWMKSMHNTFLRILTWRSWKILGWFDTDFTGPYINLLELCANVWSKGAPAWEPSSYPVMMQSFEDHNAYVRKAIPRERLLEFHPSQGWAPLCEFLDLPKPDEAFPNVNGGDDVTRFHGILYWVKWAEVVKRGIPWIVVPGFVAVSAWKLGWI